MKKVISLFLSVVMLLSITVDRFVGYALTSGDYDYLILSDGTAEITGYTGASTEITIPDSIDGYRVTSIGWYAFEYCINLTSITIPNNVISIGYGTFDNCTNLTNINVDPNNQKYSSKDGVLFNKEQTILINYPANNKRTSYTIPETVIEIENDAFKGANFLLNITISRYVRYIRGNKLFSDCSNLENINVDSKNKYYSSRNGILYNGGALLKCPEANKLSFISLYNTSSVEEYAFYNCKNLKNVAFAHVSCVKPHSFDGCDNLENVSFIDNDVHFDSEEHIDWSEPSDGRYYYIYVSFPERTNIFAGYGSNAWNFAKENNLKFNAIDDYNCSSNKHCYIDSSEGKICIICGDVYHQHSYLLKTTNQASCKYMGTKIYTCSNCGETKTESIPKNAHTYKNVTTKATDKKNGKIESKCTVCGTVSKTTAINSIKSVSLAKTTYVYDGKAKRPTVTVKDSKGKKIDAKYYTVKYSSNKNVGKATVTVTFKGNYSGTVKKTFTIKPKATSISSLKAGKKKFTVKWKKLTTQTTGYEIQYSTDKNFKKNNKTATVSKNKTTSKSISKLKAKKKYYVRIRTYKTVNGTKIYSDWSKTKSVTTKK